MLMYDKNGVEIRTGDIVRITGAYFKQDNRVYYVDNSPGDVSWLGSDYSLHALNSRTGELSETKYNIAFWPLQCVVSDRFKTAEANEWNREHAQIEVIYNVNVFYVYDYFKKQAEEREEVVKRNRWNMCESELERNVRCAAHYRSVAKRIHERAIARDFKWFPIPDNRPQCPISLESFARQYANAE